MELIIIIVASIAIIIVNSMMKMNVKKIEQIALNTELNEIVKKYPNNVEICEYMLRKLENRTTKIEEDINSNSTLYMAVQDKILIGNTHESFSRIQTMAHECLHSIQDKKMLLFNFIYSNLYLMYFFIICILTIIKKLPNETIYSDILLILSFVYYVIRIYLENDAMIKAEYLAKEYMEEQEIDSKDEIKKVLEGFKEINKGIIKGTNCGLFVKIMIKVVIFNTLSLIF